MDFSALQAEVDSKILSKMDIRLIAGASNAAEAIGRLDQALMSHPLKTALLYRMRLEAVRVQADVDGAMIDQWHLAATLEGLRPRSMDTAHRIIDGGSIFEAARKALNLHQWLVEPDVDQEDEIQRAERHLGTTSLPPLLAAANGMWSWIEEGGTRPAIRAAVVRYLVKRNLFHAPLPLTGARALRPHVSWQRSEWLPAFFGAIADEARTGLDLLISLERAWFTARGAVAQRRSTSHAASAIDLLAITPAMSSNSLAQALKIAPKNAIRILDQLSSEGIAIEVTHRSKRRLFGLAGLAPLRDAVAGPYRPAPFRGRGRPSIDRSPETDVAVGGPTSPPPPPSKIEIKAIEYGNLDQAMSEIDDVIRRTRRALSNLGGQMSR